MRYILQKDIILPPKNLSGHTTEINKGSLFYPDKDYPETHVNNQNCAFPTVFVENSPEWFLPEEEKEEPIKRVQFSDDISSFIKGTGSAYGNWHTMPFFFKETEQENVFEQHSWSGLPLGIQKQFLDVAFAPRYDVRSAKEEAYNATDDVVKSARILGLIQVTGINEWFNSEGNVYEYSEKEGHFKKTNLCLKKEGTHSVNHSKGIDKDTLPESKPAEYRYAKNMPIGKDKTSTPEIEKLVSFAKYLNIDAEVFLTNNRITDKEVRQHAAHFLQTKYRQ